MKQPFIRLAILSIAVAGISFEASAQNNPQAAPDTPPAQGQTRGPINPQKQLSHLTKKLALTADQQDQILPILTDRQQQVAGVQSDPSLDEKQRHAKLKAIRLDSESRLRNVLTDTQRAAYDEMQQQARERARTRKQTTVS